MRQHRLPTRRQLIARSDPQAKPFITENWRASIALAKYRANDPSLHHEVRMRYSRLPFVTCSLVLAALTLASCGDGPTETAELSTIEVGVELAENSVLLSPFTRYLQVGDSIVLWARTVENGRGIPSAAPSWRASSTNVSLRALEPGTGGDWIRVAIAGTAVGPALAIASYKQLADTIDIVVIPRHPGGH